MWVDVIAGILVASSFLLAFVSIAFLLSGLDDCFVDICFWFSEIRQRLLGQKQNQGVTTDLLLSNIEQPVAIMIPAWDESAVIRRMLENTLRRLKYSNYHVFVGTYPNDEATEREVEVIREKFANVHRITCPHDGPTNKADCLNWLYQGIQLYEKEQKILFQIFVMDDCEDIVHPFYLKLFNHLIPDNDMVQVPVYPLEVPWYQFTAGHYLDEFAENHTKDIRVRQTLSGGIPSAGVGSAFSRKAMQSMAHQNNNQVFNVESLTEDYEFGVSLAQLGLQGIFCKYSVKEGHTRHGSSDSPAQRLTSTVAVREFFPTRFWQAVRQKSRWILGISLQGWKNMGWKGTAGQRYWFFRDRKGILTNQISVLAYSVLAVLLIVQLFPSISPGSYRYPNLIVDHSWLWYIIWADTAFLAIRSCQRALIVQHTFGWKQAFLSFPRQIWANVINSAAGSRALYLFVRSQITGKAIAWDKTAHVFPSEEELRAYPRKLGDLLLERRLINMKQLDEALLIQKQTKQTKRPLGAIIIGMGLMREDTLVHLLGIQQTGHSSMTSST